MRTQVEMNKDELTNSISQIENSGKLYQSNVSNRISGLEDKVDELDHSSKDYEKNC